MSENSPPDFIKIAKKIDLRNLDYKKQVKIRVIPFLLGPYDEKSLKEMQEVKDSLIANGYVNALLLCDLKTESKFENELDAKYIHSLTIYQNEGYLLIPLFYFPSKKQQKNSLGHHSELIQLSLTKNRSLILLTGIFHHKNTIISHHKRFFPNRFIIDSFEEYKLGALDFVKRLSPILEAEMMASEEQKSFYTINPLLKERGGNNDKL